MACSGTVLPCSLRLVEASKIMLEQQNSNCIGLNGKFLRFRRDGINISYTVICLSHFDVCLAIK
jgi:hypothetical protein